MKKYVYISLIFIVFSIFIGRIIYIRSNSLYYKELLDSKNNLIVYGSSAPRGRILDCNGVVLVDNIGVNSIYYKKIDGITTADELQIAYTLASILTTHYGSVDELKEYFLVTNNNGYDLITEEEYELYNERKLSSADLKELKLSRITDDLIDYDDITKKSAHIYFLMNDGFSYDTKLILDCVSDAEYAKVLEENLKGIIGEVTWERYYPYGDTLKSIFGSVGSITKENKEYYLSLGYELSDLVGISYLELEYEEYLRGTKAKYLVNSDNTLTLISEEVRGNDLVLSIDINLQLEIESILKDKLLNAKYYPNTEYYKDSYALISDPSTGEILAISGIRLNDDETFSDITLNTITSSFTIGSAIKGASIAVGYKYGLISIGEKLTDSCVKLYLTPAKCSAKRLGVINDLEALAYSSNYYQFMIAIKLTGNNYFYNMKLGTTSQHFDTYRSMFASFGLGVSTGIDLEGESTGIKGSTIADDLLLNFSIGQYDTYTPVQVLQYISSVATGYRTKLNLMMQIRNDDEVVLEYTPHVLNEVDLDTIYLNRIKEGMKLVLTEGTGKGFVPVGMDIAGKTGTSESFLDTNNDGVVDVATITQTFAGFYPTENPKYSIVVITPNSSHNNGTTDARYYAASKITKDITTYLLEYDS